MDDNLPAVVARNLARVTDRIAEAALRAGRSPEDVTLVGVTKYVDTAHAAALLTVGCSNLGESRPQELWDKAASPDLAAARWHLIGHLQRNKVRRTLPLVSLIHSVDSQRLLAAINREAESLGRPVDVLLEINTSGDTAKHGLAPAELPPLLSEANNYPRVSIRGLMTMAALTGGADIVRKNFDVLRELRDRVQDETPDGVLLAELSMGMSRDFEQAIAAGATLVRVGSLLWET
jgi:hypothetical protein